MGPQPREGQGLEVKAGVPWAGRVKSWRLRAESGVPAYKGNLGTTGLSPRGAGGGVSNGSVSGAHGAHGPTLPSAALPAPRTPDAQFRSRWMKRVADAIFQPCAEGRR